MKLLLRINVYLIMLFSIILNNNNVQAQCPGSTPLTISNINIINSTCPNNGSITVSVSGGISPYQYALISGGNIVRPNQSTNAFNSIAAGTYSVQVTDNCGTVVTQDNVTVTTSYVEMTASLTLNNPKCNIPGNGSVVGNIFNGTSPYTYELLSGINVIAGPQTNNTFNNLPAGTYTLRVTDACGEVRTFAAALTYNNSTFDPSIHTSDNVFATQGGYNPVPPVPFYDADTANLLYTGSGPIMINCDSVAFRIQTPFSTIYNDIPINVKVRDMVTNGIVYDNTYIPYPVTNSLTLNLNINRDYRFYFDDLCDNIDSVDRNYSNMTRISIPGVLGKSCSGNVLNLAWTNGWNTLNYYSPYVDTIRFVSGPSLVGTERIRYNVGTQDLLYNDQNLSFEGALPGTYTIEVSNSCTTYTVTQNVSAPVDWYVSPSFSWGSCKENVADVLFEFIATPPEAMMYIKITSGPASFTDNNGNIIPIIYPITDSASATEGRPEITGLPQGDYTFDAWTSCDAVKQFSFTVGTDNVLKYAGNVTSVPSCPGASSITVHTTQKQMSSLIVSLEKKNTDLDTWEYYTATSYQYNSIPDSVYWPGLPSGQYRAIVMPMYLDVAQTALTEHVCDDTLLYQEFNFDYSLLTIVQNNGYICEAGSPAGGVAYITLSGGRAPFTFQELNTTDNTVISTQADSTFTGLGEGIHRFRVTDACGNAVVKDIEVVVLGEITGQNNGCVGSVYTLSGPGQPPATNPWVSSNPSVASIDNIGNVTALTIGTTTISYTNNDGCERTMDFTVGNCAPITHDDYDTTYVNVPLVSAVSDNDTCVNPLATCIYSMTNDATNGAVTFSNDGSFTYTPSTDYTGLDSFQYQLCDNFSLCSTSTVYIYVNGNPIANNDIDTTQVNTAKDIAVAGNDTCGANPPCTVTAISSPPNGSVTLNEDGTFHYTPNNGFEGTDTFSYSLCNADGSCDTALVTVYVDGVPIAEDDIVATPVNTQVAIYASANDVCGNQPCSYNLISMPSHGNIIGGDPNGTAIYQPDEDYSGNDTFSYTLCDADGDCDTAMIIIMISDMPIAVNDSFNTNINTPVSGNAATNDFCINGPCTYTQFTDPSNGTLTAFEDDGTFTYNPNTDYIGPDSFRYILCNAHGDCDTATVYIATEVIVPVWLSNFDVKILNGCEVKISWKALLVNDIASFDLMHSTDGKLFKTIKNIPSDGGAQYTYIYHDESANTHYFKVYANLVSSNRVASNIASVTTYCNSRNIALYPNITDDIVNIKGLQQGDIVKVYDLSSRLLVSKTATAELMTLPLGSYVSGSYFVKVIDQSGAVYTFKAIRK